MYEQYEQYKIYGVFGSLKMKEVELEINVPKRVAADLMLCGWYEVKKTEGTVQVTRQLRGQKARRESAPWIR